MNKIKRPIVQREHDGVVVNIPVKDYTISAFDDRTGELTIELGIIRKLIIDSGHTDSLAEIITKSISTLADKEIHNYLSKPTKVEFCVESIDYISEILNRYLQLVFAAYDFEGLTIKQGKLIIGD